MASRPVVSIRALQVQRGKPERALIRSLQGHAVDLEEDFKRFLTRSDVLEDMAREARRLVPDIVEKASHGRIDGGLHRVMPTQDDRTSVGGLRKNPGSPAGPFEKAAKPKVPPEIQAIVERALRRARPIWDDFEANVRASLLAEEIKAFEGGARGAMNRLGFQGDFNLTNPRILDYLATRTNMLAGNVSDTSFEAMIDTITKGFFEDGLGPLDVAKQLRAEFDFLSSARARTIARTETLIASEQGQFEQFFVIGVEAKRWMSVRGPNTRQWHFDAHNQTVSLFEPFIVNGEEMMHPGDPTGSPENIINCECGLGPVVEAGALDEPWRGN